MQKRNSILKQQKNMRSGMAMIMAIGFLVLIGGMAATMLNLSAVASKKNEHIYFSEQAQLLARSATEFALLAISGHNRTPAAGGPSCIENINATFNGIYNIRTDIQYFGMAGTCSAAATAYIPVINTQQSVGTVLIDVYVTTIPGTLNINEEVAYHRRTIQKP